MDVRRLFSIVGLCFCFMAAFWMVSGRFAARREARVRSGVSRNCVTMVAFGDVNLGRTVGQRILADEIDFPFQKIALDRNAVDVVFANLESQLSEQHGETQDPFHNMIFTGPPNGAKALASFGLTHVSTANNHAFDYGKEALFETVHHLDEEGIAHVGTARSAKNLYEPLEFVHNGIRFALFAVTDLMNFKNGWHDFVAVADSGELFPAIREAAQNADVVILSFHGGEEYGDGPTSRVKSFADACVRQGVKVFLGHHPHVPYGVRKEGGAYIFHSLGNFVFYQPQLFWTQVSFAAVVKFEKRDSMTTVADVECIPLTVGYQPTTLADSTVLRRLEERIQGLSNIPLSWTTKGYLK